MLELVARLLIVACPQETPATTTLEELIARSSTLRSCRARYRLTRTGEAEAGWLQFDLFRPEGLRLEADSEATGAVTSWCRDGVFVGRFDRGGERTYARVDWNELVRRWTPLEQSLRAEFKSKRLFSESAEPVVEFAWDLDADGGNGSFFVLAFLSAGVATPFGWLTTLERKGSAPIAADGELQFSSDAGKVQVAVSTANGLLLRFAGASSDSTFCVELEHAEFDVEPDAGLLDLPDREPGEGDCTAAFESGMRRLIDGTARERTWSAILAALDAKEAAAEQKARTVLRILDEIAYASWIRESQELHRRWIASVISWIEAHPDDTSVQEVAELLAEARSTFSKQLDEQIASCVDVVVVPDRYAGSKHADEVLSIERQVVRQTLSDRLRDPLLAEFDTATALDR